MRTFVIVLVCLLQSHFGSDFYTFHGINLTLAVAEIGLAVWAAVISFLASRADAVSRQAEVCFFSTLFYVVVCSAGYSVKKEVGGR